MKKILFLLMICFIKLNAYEYVIQNFTNTGNGQLTYKFFTDSRGRLHLLQLRQDGSTYLIDSDIWISLQRIKFGGGLNYVTSTEFNSYFQNNSLFMNDLYVYFPQQILNYLYNNIPFAGGNRIEYENYELLYNSDGLVVESIVDGKWAGLYDDSGKSGYLYNRKGELLYVNGEPSSFLEKINNRLLKRFKINLESIFIKKIFYPLLVLIFACVVLRSVIRLAIQAFLIRFYDKKISQLEKRREKIENA